MPFHKKVHSSWFMVHGFKKEVINHKLSTTNRKSFGFTLIELLIVVAIIGILSSFAIYSFQNSQQKGRDAKRKSDLQLVKKALEHAKNDCLGASYYRTTAGANESVKYYNLNLNLKSAGYTEGDIQDPQYVSSNPTLISYRYVFSTGTVNVCPNPISGLLNQTGAKYYVLRAKLEITADPDSASSYNNCADIITNKLPANVFSPPANSGGDGYFYVCPD